MADQQQQQQPPAEGQAGQQAPAGQQAQPGQQEDYLDKGLDAVEKKFGSRIGHGFDNPEQMRSTNEKITDGARGLFEKFSGKKVPEKFSN